MTCIFRYISVSILLLMLTVGLHARERKDGEIRALDTIPTWQGGNIKFDIGNLAYELIASDAKRMSFEAALNFNLKRRFFPTLEIGYANAHHTVASGASYKGQGGFSRIGLDINCFKPEHQSVWLNLILIGARVGVGTQHYDMLDLSLHDEYFNDTRCSFTDRWRTDCWVEINASLQLTFGKHFTMGWGIRERILCTRGSKAPVTPWYIPGYGTRKNASFGFNYYIGYRF